MAAARLFRADGMGLRFDGRFRHTGGSDNDLFRRFTRAGGQIVWIDEAILREEFPVERMNLRWNFARYLRMTNNAVFMERYHLGLWRGAAEVLKLLPAMLFWMSARLILGLVRYPLDPTDGRRNLFMATMKAAGIWGIVLGLSGIKVHPYRKTEGS